MVASMLSMHGSSLRTRSEKLSPPGKRSVKRIDPNRRSAISVSSRPTSSLLSPLCEWLIASDSRPTSLDTRLAASSGEGSVDERMRSEEALPCVLRSHAAIFEAKGPPWEHAASSTGRLPTWRDMT